VPDDWSGDFLFVGETSVEYERTGDLYAGLSGQEFKRLLIQAGIKRNQVAFVPILRCKPSKTPKMSQIRACAPFVYRTIAQIAPRYIVALGRSAYRSLANSGSAGTLAKSRGRTKTTEYASKLGVRKFVYTVTSSLAQLATSPNEAARFLEDIKRQGMPLLEYPSGNVLPTKSKYLSFDTEYTPQEVLCGAVSDGKQAVTVEAKSLSRISGVLSKAILIGHNLPVDIDALIKAKVTGITVALEQWLRGNKQRDTLLIAKLADENRGVGGYTLESLLLARHNAKDYKAPTEALGPDPTLWPLPLRDERCRLDAWATFKVFEAFEPDAEGPQHITHKIAMTLHRMKHAGVYISMPLFQKMKQEVYAEEAKTKKVLLKFAKKHGMSDFEASKDNDVRELVYDKLGLKIESYTAGGLASSSAKVLKEYQNDYPEIQALLSYSKADKLKTTYCDGLEKKMQRMPDGRFWIPVQINALAAKTGRRSSASPNFQNWPVRVRKIVVSRFKGGNIADNDYSKLEPIAGGWVTGEHRLTEYFTKYPNGYIKIGEDFFKKTVEKSTKEYTAIKSLVLAIIYNKKKWSLADDLWVTQGVKLDSNYEKHVEESGKLLDRFLSTLFPGVKKYHQRQEATVLQQGCVSNALGQIRRLPLPPEPERSDKFAYRIYMRFKSHVINQAINYPIQSLASYVTGSAMIDLEEALLSQFKWSYVDYHTALMQKKWPHMPLLCIEVHDDIVQDIPRGMEKKTKEVTHDIMSSVPTLRKLLPEFDVPLSIDTNVGPTWGVK
jgi:uracil-DNA glycosylase family 4